MKSILKKFNLIVLIAFKTVMQSQGKIISIPAEYTTIQDGINISVNGDTVLVSSGTYYENINFNGKNIVIASLYILENNPDYIKNTIIDGSQAENPDSASCVFFCSGEDSTAVIEGFTLTKGAGTRYLYPNGWFREGGGVFVEKAQPTIKNNLIIRNEVLNASNVTSAGGGAIRANLGNPHIYNNVIMLNKALFGAAIVLDNSNGIVKNNIIYKNTGATSYSGGGAFWMYGVNCNVTIENNTILANSTGGIFVQVVKTTISNNIIWGNEGYQISYSNGFGNTELIINNNNIQDGYAENMSSYPIFTDSSFFLDPSSPSIDAGLDNELYNDQENQFNPGTALWPSLGNVRNDMGAYGGQLAKNLPFFEFFNIACNTVNFGTTNIVGITLSKNMTILNQSSKSVHIDRIVKSANSPLKFNFNTTRILGPMEPDTISLEWTPQNDQPFKDSLFIYHNLTNIANPLIVQLKGKAKMPTSLDDDKSNHEIILFPNPATGYVSFEIFDESLRQCKIFNATGQLVICEPIHSGLNQIDLMTLSKGVYFVRLAFANKVLTQKLVVD